MRERGRGEREGSRERREQRVRERGGAEWRERERERERERGRKTESEKDTERGTNSGERVARQTQICTYVELTPLTDHTEYNVFFLSDRYIFVKTAC